MNNIMILLEEIEYGYKDKDGNIHYDMTSSFSDDYRLQSPDEIKESKPIKSDDRTTINDSLTFFQ